MKITICELVIIDCENKKARDQNSGEFQFLA